MPLNRHLVLYIIDALWLTFWGYWLANAFSNKRTVFRQSRLSRSFYILLAAAFAFVIVHWPALAKPILSISLATQLIGITLTVTGIALAIWARRILGRNWSGIVTIKENHELIRRGPYAYVRHPIYSGVILAAFGSILAILPDYRGLACLLFVLIGLKLKSRYEEKLLCKEFPEQYPQYIRQVKALIPFIY